MLSKKDIIDIISKIDILESDNYWLVAGAALVMHGVKEYTRDIDLGCTIELADKLVVNGCKHTVGSDGKRIIQLSNNIEVFENWEVDKIEVIDGIPVGSLESIKKQKIELGREKDLEDIKLIEKFQINNNLQIEIIEDNDNLSINKSSSRYWF